MSAAKSPVEDAAFKIRHGGWYDGDNHKPGRGWYFVCSRCRHVGLGWLLRQSAVKDALRHDCRSGAGQP